MKKVVLGIAIGATIVASFQNCGDTAGFTSISSGSAAASSSSNTTPPTGMTTTTTGGLPVVASTPPPAKDVLGQISFANIASVELIGTFDPVVVPKMELRALTTINSSARTISSDGKFFMPFPLEQASCGVVGTNADFSELERGLKAMTFVPDAQQSNLPDLGALTMVIRMKDGTPPKSFVISMANGGTFGANVDVSAAEIVASFWNMKASASCNSSLSTFISDYINSFF